MKNVLGLVVLLICVSSSGCGSGSSGAVKQAGTDGGAGSGGANGDAATNGGACPFTPCGGNIVSTWRIASICGKASSKCPPVEGVTVNRSASQATYTFNGDGTLVYAASGTLSETIPYPLECISNGADAGLAQACAEFQAEVQASIQSSDGGLSSLTSFTCSVDVGQTCVCNEIITVAPQTQSGFYTVSGNQVTITITASSSSGDGGVGDAGINPPADYCVSGNTLTIHSIKTSGEEAVAILTK